MNHRTWLTMAVERARTGLRTDVQALIDAFATGQLILPLAQKLQGFAQGERRSVSGELALTPQLLQSDSGHLLLPAFTWEEPIARFARDWRTDGGPLEVCTLPALAVLDLAERMVDGVRVARLVLDPGQPRELGLLRPEIVSLRERRALPLLAYASKLPPVAPVLDAEQPSAELIAAVRRACAEVSGVLAQRVERWFDPERELQSRLVVTARVLPAVDQKSLAHSLGVTLADFLRGETRAEVRFETVPPEGASSP